MLQSRALSNLQPMLSLLIFLMISLAKAETTIGPNYPSLDETTYQPNLVVVIGILGVMFVLTILILVYAKLCHRAATEPQRARARTHHRANTAILGPMRTFSGIEKTVIESLPFFRFSSLKGSKEGLECAVCLSRFEDVEVLRLLPKCRHAFHIDCIDHWLESHSTCPLCRDRVSPEDVKLVAYSNSLRFLCNDGKKDGLDLRELEGNENEIELFVQREESSRFDHMKVEEKHNHKMVLSGLVLNNRWSDLRSSDFVLLSSEMLNDMSSARFSDNDGETRARLSGVFASTSKSLMSSGEQRSASEITGLSRCVKSKNVESSSEFVNSVKEDRIRKVWLSIAKRTVHWFANRERSQLQQNPQRQTLDVV